MSVACAAAGLLLRTMPAPLRRVGGEAHENAVSVAYAAAGLLLKTMPAPLRRVGGEAHEEMH
ncbi:hypothetical protein [Streptomyces sp. CNQ085]|uniref:hypothetical protein n=1 Tax=Streptomyces sp. CNQ085 TaxID=2886944 RepID=UPI001F50B327|nr:hypothetical protein [Streptomyces sp. CNQ085]MCI0385542.1 hypothetical protein [Streptomyces sp. CNQ085]